MIIQIMETIFYTTHIRVQGWIIGVTCALIMHYYCDKKLKLSQVCLVKSDYGRLY